MSKDRGGFEGELAQLKKPLGVKESISK